MVVLLPLLLVMVLLLVVVLVSLCPELLEGVVVLMLGAAS